MKSLLVLFAFVPILVFGQCTAIEKGNLRAEVHGDTVILKNDTVDRSCLSFYKMEISQSTDTIIWLEKDTGYVAGCDCHYNLSVTIDSLVTGQHFAKVFYSYPPDGGWDTICFIGTLQFDINEQNSYSSNTLLSQWQSDCFPVGIDKKPKNNDLIVLIYPNPTAEWINILTINPINKEIQIFDINSRNVLTLQSNESLNTINLFNFTNGIYILKVISNEFIYTSRFCKY